MAEFKEGIIILDGLATIRYIDKTAKELLQLNEDCNLRSIKELITDKLFINIIESSFFSKNIINKEFSPNDDKSKLLSIKIVPSQISENSEYLIVLTDLTELKRLEGIQKEFVANVSHELRTPLTSIKMAAESLQLGAITDDRMKHKFLSNIQREADRLTRLVNELLVIAKLDSKITLHISKFNLFELLNDVIISMTQHADLNDITLVSDFSENLSLLEADKDRIKQVLINLVDNAIKCNRKNGKVTVSAHEKNGNVIIKIIDTGIGIHNIDIDKIFDRFFRVDKARSRVTGGTGLGLSIVKDLIVAHNGIIDVESEVDVGTTFIITLPIKASIVSDI